MKRILPAVLLMLSLTACWEYVKPRVAIDVTNKSNEPIRNIEVDYPGGSYGIPALDVNSVNHHTSDIDKKNCVITMKFENSKGEARGGKQMNLGEKCPARITVVVDAQMAVSAEASN